MNRAAFALVLAVCMGATLGGIAYAQDLTGLVKQAESEAKDGKHLDAYDTMRKATLGMWSAGPLLFRKALFVTASPDGFGIYDPRPDSVFKQGEKLIIYVEPVGFEWEPKDGLNHARLVVDLVLKDGEGTVVGEQESFGTFTFDSREQNMEIMAALTIDFTEAPAGKYAAELKFNDKVGEKSASFELPFEIAE
jgi:hypothetical protein